jgi:hypothetical protein
MKRTALAVALILALLVSMMAEMRTFEVAKANFLPAPAIIIYSPGPIIYTNTSLSLSVVVNILHSSPEIVCVLYCVDGSSNVTLTNLAKTNDVWFDPYKVGSTFSVTSVLENLAEGNHTLMVFSQDADGNEMSSSVKFTINTHYRYPEAVILSPQNKTYAMTEVPLIWTCDERIVSADYFLDSPLYGSTVLLGNTTLTGLSNGTHTITVYVFTERGQADSQTVHFTVSPEVQQRTEPFPTILVAFALASVAIVGTGLLVYFKKHNH